MNYARLCRRCVIPSTEAERLLKEVGGTSEPYLDSLYPYPNSKIVVLNDGNVLWLMSSIDQCFLFGYKDIERLLKHLRGGGSHSPLDDRFDEGEEFVSHIPALCQKLSTFLGVSVGELDFSLESINRLSQAILELGHARWEEPDFFIPLVAYTGEVLLRNIDGHWEVTYDTDHDIWQPDVLDGRGNIHHFWARLAGRLDSDSNRPLSWLPMLIELYHAGESIDFRKEFEIKKAYGEFDDCAPE